MKLTKKTAGPNYASLIETIREIHRYCQARAAVTVNQALSVRNWLVGAYVVEYEQFGKDRAEYGRNLIRTLARDLTRALGEGYSGTSLKLYRQFYLAYPLLEKGQTVSDLLGLPRPEARKGQTLSDQSAAIFEIVGRTTSLAATKGQTAPAQFAEREIGLEPRVLFASLSWSHLVELVALDSSLKRAFYEIETVKNNWSVRV